MPSEEQRVFKPCFSIFSTDIPCFFSWGLQLEVFGLHRLCRPLTLRLVLTVIVIYFFGWNFRFLSPLHCLIFCERFAIQCKVSETIPLYRGSVHPLQDVALRITSPVVSLSGISAPSDSFHLHDVVTPSLLQVKWDYRSDQIISILGAFGYLSFPGQI